METKSWQVAFFDIPLTPIILSFFSNSTTWKVFLSFISPILPIYFSNSSSNISPHKQIESEYNLIVLILGIFASKSKVSVFSSTISILVSFPLFL